MQARREAEQKLAEAEKEAAKVADIVLLHRFRSRGNLKLVMEQKLALEMEVQAANHKIEVALQQAAHIRIGIGS